LSRSTGARPEVDVALLTALLASYIWLWQGAFPGDFFVCATLYLGIGVWSHWRRNETAADIGLRVDNFGPAVWFGMKLVGPIILAAVALGTFLGTIGPPEQTGVVEVAGSLAWGMAWATVQQYGLACVYYRFLVPVTFVGGVIACQVYRRAPNLFVLGLLHVLLSNALRLSFGPAITHHMRVGPGYWHV